MYIKNNQVYEIRKAAQEIKRLVTLETCGLRDEFTEAQRLWLKWFDVEANNILKALDELKK